MNNIATGQNTGLCVLFSSKFVLPEVAFYYTSDAGLYYLSIASIFKDSPAIVWQINFLARLLAKRHGVREAIFEILGDTITYRVLK